MSEKRMEFEGEVRLEVQCHYLLFLPRAYWETEESFPLMLFLHGAEERGDDLELIKTHGPPKIAERQGDFPFILLCPQCPDGEVWSSELLLALLDDIERRYRVDRRRLCVTGLSMGGYGTWELGCACPERFSALVPICGGGIPLLAHKLREVAVWVFHGALDEVVPLEESIRMVKALRECGGEVRFTIYPDLAHNCWSRAYEEEELYRWLLSQRRQGAGA